MRHLSFADEDEDEDEDGNEGFALDVPRRHFAMPLTQGQIGSATAPANVFAVAEPAETNSIDCSAGTAGDSDLLDDGYSSLLELSRRSLDSTTANKQPFIRIEEAEDGDGEEFEPVVVFPGQAARLPQAEAAPPAAPAIDRFAVRTSCRIQQRLDWRRKRFRPAGLTIPLSRQRQASPARRPRKKPNAPCARRWPRCSA